MTRLCWNQRTTSKELLFFHEFYRDYNLKAYFFYKVYNCIVTYDWSMRSWACLGYFRNNFIFQFSKFFISCFSLQWYNCATLFNVQSIMCQLLMDNFRNMLRRAVFERDFHGHVAVRNKSFLFPIPMKYL